MAESLETQMLRGELDVDCPGCDYPFWVRMSEVVVQTTVMCPCCRTRIHLVDDRGSVANVAAEIESTIEQALADLFKGL